MLILAISSASVLFIYTLISIIKDKDIPESLSATHYLHPSWIFPTIMVFCAATLLPCWLEITEGNNLQFLSFLACAGLMFVGLAPNYKNDKDENKIHSTSAYLAALCAILSVSFVIGSWVDIVIGSLVIFGLNYDKIKTSYIFLLETAIFVVSYVNVIYKLS